MKHKLRKGWKESELIQLPRRIPRLHNTVTAEEKRRFTDLGIIDVDGTWFPRRHTIPQSMRHLVEETYIVNYGRH